MYSFVICIYLMAVKLVSLFNKKVRLMVRGHAQVFRILREHIEPDAAVTSGSMPPRWESSSRDVRSLERIRRDHPEYKISAHLLFPLGV